MTGDELRAYLAGFPSDLPSARAFVDRPYHRVPWYAPMIARYVHHRFGRPPIQLLGMTFVMRPRQRRSSLGRSRNRARLANWRNWTQLRQVEGTRLLDEELARGRLTSGESALASYLRMNRN